MGINWKQKCNIKIKMTAVNLIANIEKEHETTSSDLQNRCHKHRTAHQGKNHEAGEALLSDTQEFGLLPRGRAL